MRVTYATQRHRANQCTAFERRRRQAGDTASAPAVERHDVQVPTVVRLRSRAAPMPDEQRAAVGNPAPGIVFTEGTGILRTAAPRAEEAQRLAPVVDRDRHDARTVGRSAARS